MLSGKIRSAIVLTLLLALLPTWTGAQAYKNESEADLYERSKEKLLRGRDLERAITLLSALVVRKPGNADYQTALGCACVSRLASLYCAAEDAKIIDGARRSYQRRLRIWHQMQADPALPLFGRPQPSAPLAPTTPDDSKAYDPLETTTQQRLTDLTVKALHSFHEALSLGRSLAPRRKAEVNYTCGWGFLLLYKSAKESVRYQEHASPARPDSADLPLTPTPTTQEDRTLTHDEMIACFQACADFNSKKPDYRQSLAFAYAPDYLSDILTSFDEEKLAQSQNNSMENALKSMQSALALPGKRADPDLLYQAALLADRSFPDKALESLKKLTAVQNTNAVNFYLLAEAHLRHAEHLTGDPALKAKQDALSAIESGNQAPRYYNVEMVLPVPKSLALAWNYHRTYGLGLDSHCLDSLFGLLSNAGLNSGPQKDGEFAMRGGVCMMEMGLNALRHYEGADLDPGDLRTHAILYDRAFMGIIFCGRAYKLIQSAAIISPSQANISLAEEYAQSAAYWKAWDAALIKQQ